MASRSERLRRANPATRPVRPTNVSAMVLGSGMALMLASTLTLDAPDAVIATTSLNE